MIHLENVYFSYTKRNILQNIDLTLHSGHIYGLLGENGVGKSTLLKGIAGVVFPQSGGIHVYGFQPKDRQGKFLSDVFFLPEEFSLPSLSIRAYMDLYAPFYPKFDAALFYRLLDELEVSRQEHLDQLSYGQKKKVFIAFGLATQTRLVLMDEPTNGLDIPSKSQFRRIIASALTQDRSFLISTHQIQDLNNLIDHLIILKNQRIVLSDSLEHIANRLSFRLSADTPKGALYSERSLHGAHSVNPNTSHEEGTVEMDLLFKAILLKEKEVISVLEHQTTES